MTLAVMPQGLEGLLLSLSSLAVVVANRPSSSGLGGQSMHSLVHPFLPELMPLLSGKVHTET